MNIVKELIVYAIYYIGFLVFIGACLPENVQDKIIGLFRK